MLKNKFKFAYLFLLGTVGLSVSSCNNDEDTETYTFSKTTTIDFEDLKVGESGYWKGDTTGIRSEGDWGSTDYTGGFTSGVSKFENIYNIGSYGPSWKGFAYSTLADSTVKGNYDNEMFLYGTSGANDSKTFAIAFSDGATITFPVEVSLQSVLVNNNTYTYKVIRDGNDYTDGPFKEGSWFTVKFTGYNAKNKKVGEKTYYLADYRDGKKYICQEWSKVDLSTLRGVKKVVLSFDGSDKGNFGLNTPSYVCIDNLVY